MVSFPQIMEEINTREPRKYVLCVKLVYFGLPEGVSMLKNWPPLATLVFLKDCDDGTLRRALLTFLLIFVGITFLKLVCLCIEVFCGN